MEAMALYQNNGYTDKKQIRPQVTNLYFLLDFKDVEYKKYCDIKTSLLNSLHINSF